ncbi:sensor histidine kinase [Xylanibacillus composti]|nr:histidine kinase [Xylanibacillus composti]
MRMRMEPHLYVNGWRFLTIGVLFHLWVIGQSSADALVLILLLLVMACLRWRFALPAWTSAIDASLCLVYAPFTAISCYGLALPVFELALKGRWLLALLPFASLFLFASNPGFLFWYLLQALFFGMFSSIALHNERRYRLEADNQRKARYELERIKLDLLAANESAAQQAELMERYRIARQLHDHLGHDLTGASLALQAYEYVQDPDEARKLLEEVKKRLERSTVSLRETVHNMTPVSRIGIENLENIVNQFPFADIHFQKSGDMLLVSAYQWPFLEACLKEALTNVARHSNATQVKVDMQVSRSIARLLIQDNGSVSHDSPAGSGLRSLQMRARSLGGSLSVSREGGCLLVCVLPLGGKEQ